MVRLLLHQLCSGALGVVSSFSEDPPSRKKRGKSGATTLLGIVERLGHPPGGT